MSNDVTTATRILIKTNHVRGSLRARRTEVEPAHSEIVQNTLSITRGAYICSDFKVAPLHENVSVMSTLSQIMTMTLSNSLVHTFTTELGAIISAVGHLSSGGGSFLLFRHSRLSCSCETRFLRRSLSDSVPDLRMRAERNEMTCIVLPRPMSSPRIAPRPRIYRSKKNLTPSR